MSSRKGSDASFLDGNASGGSRRAARNRAGRFGADGAARRDPEELLPLLVATRPVYGTLSGEGLACSVSGPPASVVESGT